MQDKKYIWRVVLLIGLGWLFVYADRTVLYPMLEAIANEYSISATQAGMLASAYFFTYNVMQIPSGFIADKIGLKKLLVLMYFAAGISLFGLGFFSSSYLAFLFFIILHGFGAGAYGPTAFAITIMTLPPKIRSIGAALTHSGMSIGLGIGMAISGPFYLATNNWRIPFIILAIPTCLLAMAYHFGLRQLNSPHVQKSSLKGALRNKNILLICLSQFLSLYGFWVAITWGPTFFVSEKGFDLSLVGYSLGFVTIISIPFALGAAYISEKIGKRKLGVILACFASLSILIMSFVQTMAQLFAVLVIYAVVGKLVWNPLALTWVGEIASEKHSDSMGAIMGFFNFSGMASAIVAPTISGLIKDLTGSLTIAFYLGSASVLIAALVISLIDTTAKKAVSTSLGEQGVY